MQDLKGHGHVQKLDLILLSHHKHCWQSHFQLKQLLGKNDLYCFEQIKEKKNIFSFCLFLRDTTIAVLNPLHRKTESSI